jgi:hypothetical protein
MIVFDFSKTIFSGKSLVPFRTLYGSSFMPQLVCVDSLNMQNPTQSPSALLSKEC